MYPTEMVEPMIDELTSVGFDELKTPEAVDDVLTKEKGTTLVFINSVCGCSARSARPAVKLALEQTDKKPDHVTTTFAGFDVDAVEQTRKYTLPYPPSSPSIALFKDGKLAHFVERHQIEGKTPEQIAENLTAAFDEFC